MVEMVLSACFYTSLFHFMAVKEKSMERDAWKEAAFSKRNMFYSNLSNSISFHTLSVLHRQQRNKDRIGYRKLYLTYYGCQACCDVATGFRLLPFSLFLQSPPIPPHSPTLPSPHKSHHQPPVALDISKRTGNKRKMAEFQASEVLYMSQNIGKCVCFL